MLTCFVTYLENSKKSETQMGELVDKDTTQLRLGVGFGKTITDFGVLTIERNKELKKVSHSKV